jgi:hypothetical protein
MNFFTSAVIAVLIILSLVLTAGVLFPDLDSAAIIDILIGGGVLAAAGGLGFLIYRRFRPAVPAGGEVDRSRRASWRMPPLALLAAPKLSTGSRIGLIVLRTYLLLAMIMVIVRVFQLALGR